MSAMPCVAKALPPLTHFCTSWIGIMFVSCSPQCVVEGRPPLRLGTPFVCKVSDWGCHIHLHV